MGWRPEESCWSSSQRQLGLTGTQNKGWSAVAQLSIDEDFLGEDEPDVGRDLEDFGEN